MKSAKKSILLIVFFVFIISCKSSKNTETEPNNTFANANKIEINSVMTGYIESENDIDIFVLDVNEEQVLKVELSAIKGVNTAINIYRNENPKPQLIKVFDDNRKSAPETFANLYVQPGQYYFSITHGIRDIKKGNTETPYKLLITSRPFLNEEKEPNDNSSTATEITDKSITKGFFSPGQNSLNNDTKNKMKEIDWYKFNINVIDGKPVLIDLGLTGVNGIDSVISILNSNMEEIITTDSGGTGEGEVISDFGIKESGTYYVQISSKNFLFNNEIPYELKLDLKLYDQNSELEPNNSFEKANFLNSNIINGKINGPDDIDFFYFVPPVKNKYYHVRCTGSEGLDIIMKVYDNNRRKLFDVNNSGISAPEIIPPFILKGPIYIVISASAFSAGESKYALDIEPYNSNENIELEPNDSIASATVLNKKISGFINFKNDIDYYLIKYEERKKVKITIKGVKDGKIRISTTDQLGFIIKSKEVDSDEEISFSEIFDRKGYLLVESIIPNFENPYTITIEDL